jgi:hypothetical protein
MAEVAVAYLTRRALLALLLLALLPAGAAWSAEHAGEEAVAERRIKAAYLYRFAGYVEWPAGTFSRADTPLSIGVWGNDELAEDLVQLVAARTIDGRRIAVRRVRDAEALTGLHLVFVARSRTARLPEALSAGPARGTLIVTESAGGLPPDSALNFVNVDGQIRFEVSLEAAERRGLKLSSRLVSVSNNLSGRR